jgi:hypothetical protein
MHENISRPTAHIHLLKLTSRVSTCGDSAERSAFAATGTPRNLQFSCPEGVKDNYFGAVEQLSVILQE